MAIVAGRGLFHGDVLPDAFRLIWAHGFTADFGDEQSGCGESLVAELLRIESVAWAAREETVGRITFDKFRRGGGRLTIGRTGDYLAHQAPMIPAGFAKIYGEPIQQLRV